MDSTSLRLRHTAAVAPKPSMPQTNDENATGNVTPQTATHNSTRGSTIYLLPQSTISRTLLLIAIISLCITFLLGLCFYVHHYFRHRNTATYDERMEKLAQEIRLGIRNVEQISSSNLLHSSHNTDIQPPSSHYQQRGSASPHNTDQRGRDGETPSENFEDASLDPSTTKQLQHDSSDTDTHPSLGTFGAPPTNPARHKTLVIFTCSSHPESQINTAFFMDFAIFQSDIVDFLIVVHGRYPIHLPRNLRNNVRVVYSSSTQRLNFNTWRDALVRVAMDDYSDWSTQPSQSTSPARIVTRLSEKYRHFILLNSNVRGPFLQTFVKRTLWPFYITKYLSKEVKLVGLTANFDSAHLEDRDTHPSLKNLSSFYHVQSALMAFDMKFLVITWNTLFSNEQELVKDTFRKELLATQLVMQAGYKTQVLSIVQQSLRELDTLKSFMDHSRMPSECKLHGYDVSFPHCYFGVNPNIFEVMFVRSNHTRWPDGALMHRVVSQYSLYYYYTLLRCSNPDHRLHGASCLTRGAWLYRDDDFECSDVMSSSEDRRDAIIELIRKENSLKSILDVGGGLGENCEGILEKGVAQRCTVLEPAPLYGCIRDGVGFLRGNILDPNYEFSSGEKYDALMLIDTLDSMYLLNRESMLRLIQRIQETGVQYIILSPINQDFLSALQNASSVSIMDQYLEDNIVVVKMSNS